MNPDPVIDSFVNWINANQKEPLPKDEVPEHLRKDESEYGWFYWEIIKKDLSNTIEALQSRIPFRFPHSVVSLFSRYQFPGLQLENVFILGNTGARLNCDLEVRLFLDEHMSPFLLKNGYLQIGNPEQYANYDPICLDMSKRDSSKEPPVIQLDHEEILCDSKVHIVKTIAPSFCDLLQQAMKGSA